MRVIPTKSVQQCISALIMYNPDDSLDDNENMFNEVSDKVVYGQITNAVRDTVIEDVDVHEGDYIGFVGDEILSDGKDRNTAAKEMLSRLDTDEYGVMLIIVGEETSDGEADELYKELSAIYKNTEIIMINGGQPIYDYMIVLE